MKKIIITLCILASVAAVLPVSAQNKTDQSKKAKNAPTSGLFIAVNGGPEFGVGTFRSFEGSRAAKLGIDYGAELGYRFSPAFSIALAFSNGNVNTIAQDCCKDLWYEPATGARYTTKTAPTATAVSYADMQAATKAMSLVLRPSLNLIGLFNKKSALSLELGPQAGVVRTETVLDLGSKASAKAFDAQWHLAAGGQAALGCKLGRHLQASVYGGVNFLMDKKPEVNAIDGRFDCIPYFAEVQNGKVNGHVENFLFDCGLKLGWNF